MTAPGHGVGGDGDGRPGNGARHIGHAADVEEDANDDADSDRHRCQSSNCVSLASHSSHLLPRCTQSKGRLFALFETLSEKSI